MNDQTIFQTPSAYDFPLLIKQLLISPVANPGDGEIVYGDRVRHGYGTLFERIGKLANVLDNLAVPADATVAVMDWDSHRYLEGYFAIPMTGRVLQTVNIRLSPDQIAYTLNHARAHTLVVHRDFLAIVEAIRDHLSSVEHIVLIDEERTPPDTPLAIAGEFERLIAGATADYEFPDFDEQRLATLFFTSGTTGHPKGVYYSHRQMTLHTLGTVAILGSAASQGRFHRDDIYMPITPLFHAHAWGVPYAATMMGVKQVYPGRYEPEILLRLIREEQVTFCHCVSTILQMLLEHPDSEITDFGNLKMLIGGGPLPQGLARAALERGIDIFTGYGMSETGPVQTINHLTRKELHTDLDEQVRLRTRTGRPVFLCDVRTVDSQMNFLPRDGKTAGEVVFRSPWLTQGYHEDPGKSEELWRGGWLHSGDIGVFSPDGSLQITDRLKDVIKTGGEWVSSLELESLISRHPGVAEVAVIGIPDDRWGERPLALVVPGRTASPPTETDLKSHIQAYVDEGVIPGYAVPESVRFVEALEKTSVGKLDKKRLRSRYGQGR